MYKRLLEYQQKYSNAQCRTQKLVVLILYLFILSDNLFRFFFIFSIGIKIEDWPLMGRQRFSNLQNQYIIKILMLRIQQQLLVQISDIFYRN